MNQEILTISSPINDTLHYNCKVFANNQDEIIEVGTNFYRLDKQCHYETSQLIINSAPIMQVLTMQDVSNNENDIVRQISDLESLVEQSLLQINMTKLNLQLTKYDKTISHARHSVQDISRTLDTLEKLNKVAIFSPTSLHRYAGTHGSIQLDHRNVLDHCHLCIRICHLLDTQNVSWAVHAMHDPAICHG